MINILNLLAFSYNTNYFVENTIQFHSLDPQANYVSLLNTIDSSTEHSKALYYNLSKVLDTTIPVTNKWEIPYSVNYIPSLGTNFNLIFTENYIQSDYFQESDLVGYYNLSPQFTITSDKRINLNYNNDSIFQPGNYVNFTLTDFRNTVLVELLSKTDNEWIIFPSMQRFVYENRAYNVSDIFVYDYLTPSSIQNYFRVDFKLIFTELHSDRRTSYTAITNTFNVPGLVINNLQITDEFIYFTIDWAHFDGEVFLNIFNNNTLFERLESNLVTNPIQITNNYSTGNYTFKICNKNNNLVCDQVETQIIKENNNSNFIDNGDGNNDIDVNNTNTNDSDWGLIIALSIGGVIGLLILFVFSYYISVVYCSSSSRVYPDTTHRQVSSYNNRVYENQHTYNQINRNNLPPLRPERCQNNYNNLDRHRTIANDIYHYSNNHYRDEY